MATDAQLGHERDLRLAAEARTRDLHERLQQGTDERVEAREQAERAADVASVAAAISNERARIGLILRGAGQANSAAALDLALTTDLSPQAVARILGHGAATSAPEAAPVAHGPGAASAVNTERHRVSSILRAPEAQDRREAALGLAVDSTVTVQQARALLSRLPKAINRTAALFGPGGYRTIEQRRENMEEFGPGPHDERTGPRGKPDPWKAAVDALNQGSTAGRPSRPAEPDFPGDHQ